MAKKEISEAQEFVEKSLELVSTNVSNDLSSLAEQLRNISKRSEALVERLECLEEQHDHSQGNLPKSSSTTAVEKTQGPEEPVKHPRRTPKKAKKDDSLNDALDLING